MYDILSIQRPTPDTTWRHSASALGERSLPKPPEAAAARSFSPTSDRDSGRMGHCIEPAPGRCEGQVSGAREGNSEALSAGAAPGHLSQGTSTVKSSALGLIRFYQACLSPAIPSSCRYYPSCSAYAYEAIEKWGVWQGVGMAVRRLLRCHPFGGHGFDPVPGEFCDRDGKVVR